MAGASNNNVLPSEALWWKPESALRRGGIFPKLLAGNVQPDFKIGAGRGYTGLCGVDSTVLRGGWERSNPKSPGGRAYEWGRDHSPGPKGVIFCIWGGTTEMVFLPCNGRKQGNRRGGAQLQCSSGLLLLSQDHIVFVQWEENKKKVWLSRIHVMFKAENPKLFAQRVAAAHQLRKSTEAVLRYNLYVDSMPIQVRSARCPSVGMPWTESGQLCDGERAFMKVEGHAGCGFSSNSTGQGSPVTPLTGAQ